ncbi:C4-dicarboxylate transporter, DctQ subunit [Alteribacillus persepolensis]|uniref:C4-dicarboxylate transporter, DctQ subunit n=1 Tax=Alteribacillus persepolensis TaxID=568899 RepID=A0A1G8A5Z3_9BACI|nr:TRAP transporter small permease [Alteribacillus persepolensis]SDH16359.1 C4-dicarboxylate transporter, DctQ subunit [Alteribacillus persepolensis]
MKVIHGISEWIDRFVRAIITTFLIVMTGILAAQIIARSVFQGGFVWTDEMARFLMIAFVFLGASAAIKDRSHITVSILEDWKPSLKKWLAPIQWVVMMAYAVFIVIVGFETLSIVRHQLSVNMGISMGYVYIVLPIAALIMIIHLVARIGKKEKEEEVTN